MCIKGHSWLDKFHCETSRCGICISCCETWPINLSLFFHCTFFFFFPPLTPFSLAFILSCPQAPCTFQWRQCDFPSSLSRYAKVQAGRISLRPGGDVSTLYQRQQGERAAAQHSTVCFTFIFKTERFHCSQQMMREGGKHGFSGEDPRGALTRCSCKTLDPVEASVEVKIFTL